MKSITRSFCRFVLGFALAGWAPLALSDENSLAAVEVAFNSANGTSPEEDTPSLKAAPLALLDKYIASLGPEQKSQVAARRGEFAVSSDGYLENVTIRSKPFDQKTKTLTMAAQGDINSGRSNQPIDAGAATVEDKKDKNPIVFIFVARRQLVVESTPAKVTTASHEVSSAQKDTSEQSRSGQTTVTTGEKNSRDATSILPVPRTADRFIYVMDDNAKATIDRRMSKVFVDRGFDVVPASKLIKPSKNEFDPDEFQKDFENSSDFTDDHRRMATRVCREAGVSMLATVIFTIGVKAIDPVTSSNTIVNVIVDATVRDCRKKLSLIVGSIGALQVNGLGADQTEAETAALDIAATKAANVLAGQLRDRGFR